MTRSEISPAGLSPRQELVKRGFDLVVGTLLLTLTAPVMAIAWILSTLDTRRNGLFVQTRVGRGGQTFVMFKIRTMRSTGGSTVTTATDPRITAVGALLRRLKLDELPQLVNVILGQMSLVGPRPDVPGFADELEGPDRIVLSVRPGITGPAAVAFRHEQQLLANVEDPDAYNRDVIWPAKVELNRAYVEHWTFASDVRWILGTVTSIFTPSSDAENGRSL